MNTIKLIFKQHQDYFISSGYMSIVKRHWEEHPQMHDLSKPLVHDINIIKCVSRGNKMEKIPLLEGFHICQIE